MKASALVTSLLAFAALLSGCGDNAPPVKLDMEVAYPTFGNLGGAPRIWAVVRAPVSAGISVGDDVDARIHCAAGRCRVDGLQQAGAAPAPGQRLLAGRVLAMDGESWLVLPASFPERVDSDLYAKVAFNAARTPTLTVSYANEGGRLEIRQIALSDAEERPPFRWK